MEAAGVAFRLPACFPGSSGPVKNSRHQHQYQPSSRASSIPATSFGCTPMRARVGTGASGFRDSGHLDFYCSAKKGGGALVTAKGKKKEAKKKLKLLQGLSKDLSTLTQMDTSLLGAQGDLISESAQVLMKHLQQLQAEEKERMRKEEEDNGSMTPLAMVDCGSSSSSSSSSSSESSSSDDECCDQVIDIRSFKGRATSVAAVVQPTLQSEESTSAPPTLEAHGSVAVHGLEHHASIASDGEVNACAAGRSLKRIEVCMGKKCKMSGSAALLEEFGKAVGGSGAVVGCKCMGKCRDGPNVRLFNSLDEGAADVSVTAPPNPLFLGVALEDVDIIAANLFAKELGLSPSILV